MIYKDLYHFTCACWNGNVNSIRFFDSIHKEWYRKDYENLFKGKSPNRVLCFAFFDFESATNINISMKSRKINVLAACVDKVGCHNHMIIGVNKILEELLQ